MEKIFIVTSYNAGDDVTSAFRDCEEVVSQAVEEVRKECLSHNDSFSKADAGKIRKELFEYGLSDSGNDYRFCVSLKECELN